MPANPQLLSPRALSPASSPGVQPFGPDPTPDPSVPEPCFVWEQRDGRLVQVVKSVSPTPASSDQG